MSDLFQSEGDEGNDRRPLADRLRPAALSEIVGQDHLIGSEGPVGRMVASGHLSSIIFWGPPGTGKTTTARLLADAVGLAFEQVSAVFSGVADLKRAFETARMRRGQAGGKGTLLFIDEIHRFNRAQQDSFLPVMEDGTVILVGATTENPSFELNAALLSRAQVLVLHRLDEDALEELLVRAEKFVGAPLALDAEARVALCAMADGDGRFVLNLAEEILALAPDAPLDPAGLSHLVQRRAPIYDKGGEGHYNLISALHKAVRGSDADAALYWLARMLDGGEDPRFITRRVVRMAVEDIGMADPQALVQAMAAKDTYEFLGSPEGELALVQAVLYLATAPKSNAQYVAFKSAMQTARETGSLAPPAHSLNAPTKLMKELGYGAGYEYDHDAPGAFSGQNFFPDDVPRRQFYKPVERGFERDVAKRLAYWEKLRGDRQS
ncbi:MAG: replication-associated recombination protein A [Rhodobiaceae bacterium]|nr:replication-associated recombination protein A [Rhodobiaceae bacterium]